MSYSSDLLLAIDPGIRGVGAALFLDGKLCAAKYVRNPVKKGNDFNAVMGVADEVRDVAAVWGLEHDPMALRPFRAVLEYPQVYTASKSKGDNNDLLPLAAVDGAIVALLGAPATRVLPREWKGTITKEAVEHRVISRLGPEEILVASAAFRDAKSLAHNVVDAVGIGLHALGRFTPKRVIHR